MKNTKNIIIAMLFLFLFSSGVYAASQYGYFARLYGSTADNGDITIEGTTSATKTTSYVVLQPTGGSVVIGATEPVALLTLAKSASVTAFGTPYVGIGRAEYTGTNDRYTIGFGYTQNVSSKYPVEIGAQTTNTASNTAADLIFATRETTGETDVPLERMRITNSGKVSIKTILPDRQLEINVGAATGGLRLTYNDSDGSAANYVDLLVDSNGDLTLDPSGGDIFGGTNDSLTLTGNLTGATVLCTGITETAADNTTAHTITISATQANITAADTFIDFRSTTGSEATIAGTAVAGVIAYNTFTGSHYTEVIDRTGLVPNMLLEIVDQTPVFKPQLKTLAQCLHGNPIIDNITIDKKRVKHLKIKPEYFVCSPKAHLFKTRICMDKGSKKAIGVYIGTDKEGRDMVASIGTGWIFVANKGKNIEVGDYLISSDTPGCAELQVDDIYRNSTVAKATQAVIWKIGQTKLLLRCIYLGG